MMKCLFSSDSRLRPLYRRLNEQCRGLKMNHFKRKCKILSVNVRISVWLEILQRPPQSPMVSSEFSVKKCQRRCLASSISGLRRRLSCANYRNGFIWIYVDLCGVMWTCEDILRKFCPPNSEADERMNANPPSKISRTWIINLIFSMTAWWVDISWQDQNRHRSSRTWRQYKLVKYVTVTIKGKFGYRLEVISEIFRACLERNRTKKRPSEQWSGFDPFLIKTLIVEHLHLSCYRSVWECSIHSIACTAKGQESFQMLKITKIALDHFAIFSSDCWTISYFQIWFRCINTTPAGSMCWWSQANEELLVSRFLKMTEMRCFRHTSISIQ
jgi:hypothetical protein